ncbi:peptide deformylase, mitochondrial-like [Venturia canescens]|uniref:peptide deformylase, mitochondrial-like n=1 Tax=Venturia canescens TaxID=32260 RepID=UPI001C9D1CE5|nr:peptide deformylase, mitochondrial-like [Venturia canescens]
MITMLRTILKLSKDRGINVEKSAKRHLSFRGIEKAIKNYLEPRHAMAYKHVCQIGDPGLRQHTEPVRPEIIRSPQFQRLIKHLKSVMRTYKAMGLSANQIGVPYQMFAMEVTEIHLRGLPEEYRSSRQMEVTPLRVFVNPKMKILDYTKVKDTEECLSFIGYEAVVPRAKTVVIEALDDAGEPVVWKAHGWAARIIQHEMDHLEGKTYVDRMEPGTLECIYWSEINNRRGNVVVKYFPTNWLQRYWWSF